MRWELTAFFKEQSSSRWFCHFDDDTYVNVPQLVATLNHYNYHDDFYLGKPSLKEPVQLPNRPNESFRFGTGGAGFCISRSLMLKMRNHIENFEAVSSKIGLPDDCTVGYMSEVLMNVKLTVVPQFHSHLEFLSQIITDRSISNQATFSYSKLYSQEKDKSEGEQSLIGFDNVVGITSRTIPRQLDPTLLKNSHCLLFPSLC